jgi:hypothetical protein
MTDKAPRIEHKLVRRERAPMRHADCGGALQWLGPGRYRCATCDESLFFGYSPTAHLKASSGTRIVSGKKVELD